MHQDTWERDAWKNKLFFGDNLSILQEHIADNSVDLIYLDPPFNSNATYNVLFKEQSGEKSAAQITAFEDTWHWNIEAEKTFHETVTEGPQGLSNLLQALRGFLGTNDMMAYLTMMAARLVELRRVLKQTGSIYLHCDPTASHYLKLGLDAVFGFENFRNEITWKRRVGSSSSVHKSNKFGVVTDTILFYAKSVETPFHPQYNLDDPDYQKYVEERFNNVDEDGRRYQLDNLNNPAYRPNLIYDYKGYKPPKNGWAISKEKMEQWDREGRLYFPTNPEGRIRRKRYVDELKGKPVQNLWTDIPEINSQAQERLGYPTQKPEALLERIIKASSNEGDIVLDPFCGCGTAIATAERLHRRWIGIDITHLAIALMRHRLHSAFRSELSEYEVIGDPKDLPSAEALAQESRYQFEWWALSLIDAMPAHDKRKGADSGIDGYINFFDDNSGRAKKIVAQVKSGHVGASQIRDLKGVLERDKAAIGAFITLKNPTREMIKEAASAGFYEATHYAGREYPRIQILTIEELLSGKRLLYPVLKEVTFKQAERKSKRRDKQTALF